MDPPTRTHDIHASEWARYGVDWRRFFPACDAPPHASLKATRTNTVCCGSALRLYGYMRDATPHYFVVFRWRRCGAGQTAKRVEEVVVIRSDTGLVHALFNECPREDLERLDEFVRSIPKHTRPTDGAHTRRARNLKARHAMSLTLNPKVDSKKQRRLQCSFSLAHEAVRPVAVVRDDLLPPRVAGGV